MADAASGKQAVGETAGWMLSGRRELPHTPPPPPCPTPQPSHPNAQPLPGHRVTVNPFPRRMSVSRKMRKLEEKSSLAGKEGKDGSGTGSDRRPLRRLLPSMVHLFSPKIFTLPLPMPCVAYWPQ